MSDSLSAGFARLLGQQASEEQKRRLYEVRDTLGLADNDALWLVLIALEHYDGLYREYPIRIADEARKTVADVQKAFAAAAALESKRALRKLADAVADASLRVAEEKTSAARVQGFALALAVTVLFGSLCLAMGHAMGSGRFPPWSHGNGVERIVSAMLGAPAGWVVALALVPIAVDVIRRRRR